MHSMNFTIKPLLHWTNYIQWVKSLSLVARQAVWNPQQAGGNNFNIQNEDCCLCWRKLSVIEFSKNPTNVGINFYCRWRNVATTFVRQLLSFFFQVSRCHRQECRQRRRRRRWRRQRRRLKADSDDSKSIKLEMGLDLILFFILLWRDQSK